MNTRIRAAVTCYILTAVSLSASAKGPPTQNSELLWSTDLSSLSYSSRPNPRYIGGKANIGGKSVDTGILFPASDLVIVYFLTKIDAGQLVHRAELQASDPFRLNLIAFDAIAGSLKYRKDLPGRSGLASVMVNNDGQFIVRTGEFVRLFAKDFSILNERTLTGKGDYDNWSIRLSPSGKTLLLDHYTPSETTDEVLDSRSFTARATWSDGPLFPIFSISDKAVLKPGSAKGEILMRSFEGSWRKISADTCVSNPVFITDQTLLNACGYQLILMTIDGKLLMQDALGKREHFEQLVSVTPDGKFLAVSAMQTQGGFLDYTSVKRDKTAIFVYDTVLRKRICRIDLDTVPRRDYDFALAPDGSKLAVLTDGRLGLYSVRGKVCY